MRMVIRGEFFLKKILHKGAQEPTKVPFFPYKHVSGRNSDHEWLRMTNASYYVIYYEKFRKIMQRTNKEALSTCVIMYIYL